MVYSVATGTPSQRAKNEGVWSGADDAQWCCSHLKNHPWSADKRNEKKSTRVVYHDDEQMNAPERKQATNCQNGWADGW